MHFSFVWANRIKLTLHFINLCLKYSIFDFNFFIYFFLFVNTSLMLSLCVDDFFFCWFFYLAYIILQRWHFFNKSSFLFQLLFSLSKFLLLQDKFFLQLLVFILKLKWCKMISFLFLFGIRNLLEVILLVCRAHSLGCIFYLF